MPDSKSSWNASCCMLSTFSSPLLPTAWNMDVTTGAHIGTWGHGSHSKRAWLNAWRCLRSPWEPSAVKLPHNLGLPTLACLPWQFYTKSKYNSPLSKLFLFRVCIYFSPTESQPFQNTNHKLDVCSRLLIFLRISRVKKQVLPGFGPA